MTTFWTLVQFLSGVIFLHEIQFKIIIKHFKILVVLTAYIKAVKKILKIPENMNE